MSTTTLGHTLDSLASAATAAGLSPEQARREGEILAAAIAEGSTGAFIDWCQETGRQDSAHEFMVAASQGRKYRTSPTALLSQLQATAPQAAASYSQALTDVCAAACLLGHATPATAGAASVAAAAQAAVRVTPPSTTWQPPHAAASEPPADFAAQAPGMLTQVLGQLKSAQERLSSMGMRSEPIPNVLDVNPFDVTTSHAPGAFPLGQGVPAPTSTPAAPQDRVETAAPQTAATQAPEETIDDVPEETKSVEELLAELDALIGLATVKQEIRRQAAILRIEGMRQSQGLKSATITRHLVFVGNPGTGKTTVARLVAGIYRALGLLSKGQLVEVDRSELVAGYLGQTAMKTAEVCEKAAGGVLFIDEAYSLNGDQYGEEAINTLVKEMEDRRNDLVVIVAGYPVPMAEFIDNNPGLASRFRTTVEFDDYSDDELVSIVTTMAAGADYDLGEGTEQRFRSLLAQQVRDQTFGNGRFARNMLEAAIGRHAWRLRESEDLTVEDLRTLLPQDFAADPDVVAWPQSADHVEEDGENDQRRSVPDAGEQPSPATPTPNASSPS